MRKLLYKLLPQLIKRKISQRIYKYCAEKLNNSALFHPWEQRELLAFIESIKDKPFDELTVEENTRMRTLLDLFTERGLHLVGF